MQKKAEVNYRSAISRVYYAVFLLARNKANISSKGKNGHKRVVEHYNNGNKDSDSDIAAHLDVLRRIRSQSDYDLEKEINAEKVDQCFSRAQQILILLGCGDDSLPLPPSQA